MMKKAAIIYTGHQRLPGACEIYRGNQPASMINAYSTRWRCDWFYFGDLLGAYTMYGPAAIVRVVQEYDIFVFPRLYIPDADEFTMKAAIARLFHLIRNYGKRIIYEVDDDYTNEHRHVVNGEAMEVASWTDAILVTTEHLGKTMNRITGRPYHILPNCLDPQLWNNNRIVRATPKTPGRIIIGLTGSPTHEADWRVLAEPLAKIMAKYTDRVELWIGGYHPEYLKDLPNTHYLPGFPYETYVSLIRGCDIIIAAVDPDDEFNMGKSPIKAVEGMGALRMIDGNQPAGAAVVATKNPVYSIAVKHRETGLLTDHTSESWYASLSLLIEDDSARKNIQINAYKRTWKTYDATKRWKDWERVFDNVLKKPSNSKYLPTLESDEDQSA